MRRVCAFLLCILALSACAQPGPILTPTPSVRPAQLPIRPTQQISQSTPTVKPDIRGPRLPGRLLFVAQGNLWLWEKDSAHQISSSGDAAQASLSPDGRQIAYVIRRPSATNIALLTTQGGEPEMLTDYESTQPIGSLERIYESMWAFYPSWSPDGKQLVFASQAGPPGGSPASDYRLSLFVMEPQPGAERSQIFAEYGVSTGHSVFSPDGKSLLFSYHPDGKNPMRIYSLNLESNTALPLESAPEQSYDPAISPDGRWLAYAARTTTGSSVFLTSMAGGQAQQVGDFTAARAPVFSPDGKYLAFLVSIPGERGFDLWFADLEQGQAGSLRTTQVQRISSDLMIDADSGLSWR